MEELYFYECCKLKPFHGLHKKVSEKKVRKNNGFTNPSDTHICQSPTSLAKRNFFDSLLTFYFIYLISGQR